MSGPRYLLLCADEDDGIAYARIRGPELDGPLTLVWPTAMYRLNTAGEYLYDRLLITSKAWLECASYEALLLPRIRKQEAAQ